MIYLYPQTCSRRTFLCIILVFSLITLSLLAFHDDARFQDLTHSASSPFRVAAPPVPYTYDDRTLPIFPPIAEALNSSQPDLCSNFPAQWVDTVQVVLKTGAGRSEKSNAHLASITSCFPNLLVVSDASERKAGHQFINVLADLPDSYSQDPDLVIYHAQRKALSSGTGPESSALGWRLDRFKFLPMINTAYEMRPNASWYVFIEDDVYIFWDNLFRLLGQYNAADPHYMGAAATGSHGRWFAYGGAGIVLSQALMRALVGDGTVLSEKYQDWTLDDCCGDAVLGYVILDKTGVKLEDLYPMFSGERLDEVGVSKERWCNPLISLHHMTEDSMKTLWHWERTRRAQQV